MILSWFIKSTQRNPKTQDKIKRVSVENRFKVAPRNSRDNSIKIKIQKSPGETQVISWLIPQVFIVNSNQGNPDRIMSQDLNVARNRCQRFILGCINKKFPEST